MQLKSKSGVASLRAGLVAASCALLAPAGRADTAPTDEKTTIDSGLLYYKEDKGRVQSIDAIVKLSRDFGDERVLGATLAVDSLTGGSPNGAIASHSAQTFATPSGKYATPPGAGGGEAAERFYTISAGDQPLFRDFHDLRVAGDVNWSQPVGVVDKVTVGGHLSKEYDFLSTSANGAWSHDFNSKNTTLGMGISAEFDQIKAVGGAPVAGSSYSLMQKQSGNESKHVYGAQLGLTQVMTRNWITQLNLSVDRASGYLNDPYKIVTGVDAAGAVLGYRFESRPDSHTRRSVYLGNKVAIGNSVLDFSLRYGTDNWGSHSSTVEAHYRIPVGSRAYVEPQLRWYKQDAADFYRLYLTPAEAGVLQLSADPRLGGFTAKTLGVKFGLPMAGGDELSIRLEGYQQDPKQHTSALPSLSGLDLNPKLKSVVLQVGWRFNF